MVFAKKVTLTFLLRLCFAVTLPILAECLTPVVSDEEPLYSTDPCRATVGDRPLPYLNDGEGYLAGYCQQLSGDIAIAWTLHPAEAEVKEGVEEGVKEVSGSIALEVHAVTEGWVAVGVNSRPSMLGADVALGWVNLNGKGFMYDAKNDDRVKDTPEKDAIQNVKLIKYREKDGITSLLYSRPLTSEDPQDRDIKDRVWIIWAYAIEDPDEDDFGDLAFHFREGATSIEFSGHPSQQEALTQEKSEL